MKTNFITQALLEDIREGDHTSLACIPVNKSCKAEIIAKENGIISGVAVAIEVFKIVDASLEIQSTIDDGDEVEKGDMVLLIKGNAQSVLKAERLALNFMQRMSGIATLTNQYVKAVNGYAAKILDTRKTTPLFREYQKLAVKHGGGVNHRFGLYDMIMIKDNHIAYAGGIEKAILSTKKYQETNRLKLNVEIEATTIKQVRQILKVGNVNRIMLDNFQPSALNELVALINGKYETEASGGIVLENVRQYAAGGVDFISIGALTHSAKSLDLSLQAI